MQSSVKSANSSLHFPALNGFRLIAALLVVIFHVEHKKTLYDLPSLWGNNHFVSNIGYHAVTFFFVLSGFLITHLLILEKARFRQINFKYFYARRSLRIFPVYFITLFIGFFIAPEFNIFHIPGQTDLLIEHFWQALGLSSIFASNFVLAGSLACIDQTWSVSVEEQFYIFWPLLISIVGSIRKLIWVLITILFSGLLLRYISNTSDWDPFIVLLLYLNRFGCMAVGGLTSIATVHHSQSNYSKVILSKVTLWIALTLTATLLILPVPNWSYFALPEALAVLFAIIIAHAAAGNYSEKVFDNRFMHLGGNLSYSLYMYHNFFIALVCNLAISIGLFKMLPSWLLSIVIMSSVIVLSFLASAISWKLFEQPILKLKSKFTIVASKP